MVASSGVFSDGCVVMAVYRPDPELLARQVDTLRRQDLPGWRCLVGIDGKDATARTLLVALVGDDPRFEIREFDDNVGVYRHFERLLACVPHDAEWVALSDQDDAWEADKLTTLVTALRAADVTAALGQARLVDTHGNLLGITQRRPCGLVPSLLLNQVTGCLVVLRRSVLDLALPFPAAGHVAIHDHWLGVCAAALGRVVALEDVLQDYVQHEANVIGETGFATPRDAWKQTVERGGVLRQLDHVSGDLWGWRVTMADALLERGVTAQASRLKALRRGLLGPRVLGSLLSGIRRGELRPTTAAALMAGALWWPRGRLAVEARHSPRRAADRRSLVCIVPRLPYDGIDGAGEAYLDRYLRLLVSLGWQVSVLAPGSEENRAAVERVAPGVGVHLANHGFGSSRMAQRVFAVLTGFNEPPPRWWWRDLDAAARDSLRHADVVDLQFGSSMRLSRDLGRRLPAAALVGTAHDVVTESVTRTIESSSARVRLKARLVRRQTIRTEREGLNGCDVVFVFNPDNETLLRGIGVTSPVHVSPPLIEIDDRPDLVPAPEQRRVLFVAALWRPENDESALWFLQHVWPSVLARVPDARLRLAGARPSQRLQEAAGPTVELTGYLADLGDAYRDTSVVVAPITRGAGLKFKVVQALALGFPLVSTSVGAEGVNALLGRPVIAPVDDPSEFSERVVAALEGELDPRDLMAQGRFTRGCLDFRSNLTRQFAEYEALVAQKRRLH